MPNYPFFPWSDDSDSCPSPNLSTSGTARVDDDPESSRVIDEEEIMFPWDKVRRFNISVDLVGPGKTCTEVINHCNEKFRSFREEMGGNVCIFKFGITTDPITRFHFYVKDGYQRMLVLHISKSPHAIEMLEAYLIFTFGKIMGCRNVAKGGEGNLPSKPGPYLTYVVAARADRAVGVA